ncbi:glycosyltransferase family 15 protein [Thermothielavioides terrestris NRRL 8126]|uniref:Glycosyltransferase family 15 protein n=1 Tax=Thermothielavioides terrestris (strain ATCC 38088 / NRRL 8126) TaxID=578455 RepID=G2RGI1_THETT|nr:glycosyltransferase family 15 protein [Thermothielavioides terrestris NRRL 8126]AEO71870.1 glycosyltransferase family 15 protein [Thermothielavioides terrestris NRRL 8126]
MKPLSALAGAIARRARRPARRASGFLKGAAIVLVLCVLEALLHAYTLRVPRPPQDLDAPFSRQCQDPRIAAAKPRESAALVMLARNSEIEEARQTIQNIEAQFNRWFHYPVVFLNNEEWDLDFVRELNASVSGQAIFDVIPKEDWSYPSWIDPAKARQSMSLQQKAGVWNGGKESYHHMCRFYSGTFYTHPALAPFKWYWRLEPGVRYTCAITYDPFVEMARHAKTYGFTVALWEEPNTCPSLFRAVDDFRTQHDIPLTPTWNAMLDTSSWSQQVWPVRKLLGLLGRPHHARSGARWNLCHYWSNFEIADLDFFRGDAYQALFRHLDRRGGFYHERWGDAPVHSLAVHLLLPPGRLHHFADFGYHHEPFFQCPGNAPGGQLPGNDALGDAAWSPETDGAIGCRCQCPDQRRRNNRGVCLAAMQAPAAFHRTSWWDRYRGRYPYTINLPA